MAESESSWPSPPQILVHQAALARPDHVPRRTAIKAATSAERSCPALHWISTGLGSSSKLARACGRIFSKVARRSAGVECLCAGSSYGWCATAKPWLRK